MKTKKCFEWITFFGLAVMGFGFTKSQITARKLILSRPTNVQKTKMDEQSTKPIRWIPETETRRAANKYINNNVVAIRLGRDNQSDGKGDPNDYITERELILGFLEALRHAKTIGVNPGDAEKGDKSNRGDYIQLILKNQPKNEMVPEFPFWAGSEEDSFGPEFHQMLRKLGDYRAEQLHKFVRQHRETILSARISGYEKTVQSPELKNFLEDMEKVGGHELFNYTASYSYPRLLFTLKDGKIKTFHLRVLNYLPSDDEQSKVINPALPPAFQEAIRHRKEGLP